MRIVKFKFPLDTPISEEVEKAFAAQGVTLNLREDRIVQETWHEYMADIDFLLSLGIELREVAAVAIPVALEPQAQLEVAAGQPPTIMIQGNMPEIQALIETESVKRVHELLKSGWRVLHVFGHDSARYVMGMPR